MFSYKYILFLFILCFFNYSYAKEFRFTFDGTGITLITQQKLTNDKSGKGLSFLNGKVRLIGKEILNKAPLVLFQELVNNKSFKISGFKKYEEGDFFGVRFVLTKKDGKKSVLKVFGDANKTGIVELICNTKDEKVCLPYLSAMKSIKWNYKPYNYLKNLYNTKLVMKNKYRSSWYDSKRKVVSYTLKMRPQLTKLDPVMIFSPLRVGKAEDLLKLTASEIGIKNFIANKKKDNFDIAISKGSNFAYGKGKIGDKSISLICKVFTSSKLYVCGSSGQEYFKILIQDILML